MTKTKLMKDPRHGDRSGSTSALGDDALAVVDAIRAGGIDIIELTMTVPGAPS